MALKEIFDSALERTKAIFGGDLATAIGKAEARRHEAPPSICVYPVGGPAGPSRNNGRNPVQMATRQVGCVAEIWGKDVGEAEAIMNNFAEAMDAEAVTSWLMENEEWDEGGDAAHGVRVSVRFRVDVPLIRTPRKTVTTGWQQTGDIVESIP